MNCAPGKRTTFKLFEDWAAIMRELRAALDLRAGSRRLVGDWALGPLAVVVAIAALACAESASALTPQPHVDVTPPGSRAIICPSDLGGGAALTWLRFGRERRDVINLDIAAAEVGPGSPATSLRLAGSCPATASSASGASLIAVNRNAFTEETGRLYGVDRAASGETSAPVALSADAEAGPATTALASSGAAAVAWEQSVSMGVGRNDEYVIQARTRDTGGAFAPVASVNQQARYAAEAIAAGIDDAGFSMIVWGQAPRSDDQAYTRLLIATRAPGGRFSAPREFGRAAGVQSLSLSVSPDGTALLAVANQDGVLLATGTARDGLGTVRGVSPGPASSVTSALSPTGAAAVAWQTNTDSDSAPDGVLVSDRPAGGDFGAPHALVARGSRLGGNEVASLRLAAAPDGRVLATWAVSVRAGDGIESSIPVAALRRADGTWEPAAALAATCREPTDAFPSFDPAGQPRVTTVDSGLILDRHNEAPSDSRVRAVHFAATAPVLGPPPKVSIIAARRQILRSGQVKLSVRCALACDAFAFSVIGGKSGARTGVFPQWRRLHAGRLTRVTLRNDNDVPETGDALRRGNRSKTVRVGLAVHACDSAARIARARRTIRVHVPRLPRGG